MTNRKERCLVFGYLKELFSQGESPDKFKGLHRLNNKIPMKSWGLSVYNSFLNKNAGFVIYSKEIDNKIRWIVKVDDTDNLYLVTRQ